MDKKPADARQRHLAILTEYDGSAFNGWQSQARGRTIQQTLIHVLEKLTGQQGIKLYGSSRTDAGVHARGHVSHFCTKTSIPANRLPLAMNSLLPPDLAVLAACDMDAGFHAQFHAVGKIYSYEIWNHTSKPAIDRNRVSHVPGPLDTDKIQRAIPALIGRKSFSAFVDTGSCDRNPVRTVYDLTMKVNGPRVTFTVHGDGFLYHMVRILAGTLVAVGQGKIDVDALPELIETGDRKLTGKTMPPQGLYLERVLYNPPLFDYYFDQIEPARSEKQ